MPVIYRRKNGETIILKTEVKEMKRKIITQAEIDHWSPDGQTYILAGKGYRINKELETVCIGAVDDEGEPWNPTTAAAALIEQGARPVTTGGQVIMDGESVVTAKIKFLFEQKKSTREISAALKAEGINISHMTVARRLQGELQGKLT